MHGFRTCEIDEIVFPETCSQCAKAAPARKWELVYSALEHSPLEYPDGPSGRPKQHQNYVDYLVKLPVCENCYAQLKQGSRLCWLLGAGGGAIVAWLVLDAMVPAGIKLPQCILAAVTAAVVSTIGLGCIFTLIAANGFGFARFDHDRKLKFKNKDYQRLFDQSNPDETSYQAGLATGAAAKGW